MNTMHTMWRDNMKCSNCHNEIPKDSKICPVCGTILAAYFEDILLTKKQKMKLLFHKIFFPVLALILLISLVLTIVFIQKVKYERITDVNDLVLNRESKDYVNDLYISDGRHYKYILTKEEQEIYDIIYQAIKNYDETITLNLDKYGISTSDFRTETLKNIKHVLSMDHPELINLGNINIYSSEGNDTKLIINYAMSHDKYNESLAQITDILNLIKEDTKDLSEYDKVSYVYNYFHDNTKYTLEHDTKFYSAYGCFVLKECNINGYAKAVQIVFNNIKVNSLIATGSLNNKYHEWNIVKVDNKYYYYDQTLANNGGNISYKGFLFKNKDYKLYHKNIMPNINGKKYLTK